MDCGVKVKVIMAVHQITLPRRQSQRDNAGKSGRSGNPTHHKRRAGCYVLHEMMRQVSTLFVESNGIYSKLENIDLWPIDRDARLYPGNNPVVAHPPCQLWGPFAKVNYARWGGEHNRPGNDLGCFQSALYSVRRWGGVLEHPAFSRAWDRYGLTAPTGIGWSRQSDSDITWVCEVWQSAYGHKARKRTWLLAHGFAEKPPDFLWDRIDGEYQIGFHDQRGKLKNKPTISGKKASATPPSFAYALINIARLSRV